VKEWKKLASEATGPNTPWNLIEETNDGISAHKATFGGELVTYRATVECDFPVSVLQSDRLLTVFGGSETVWILEF